MLESCLTAYVAKDRSNHEISKAQHGNYGISFEEHRYVLHHIASPAKSLTVRKSGVKSLVMRLEG